MDLTIERALDNDFVDRGVKNCDATFTLTYDDPDPTEPESVDTTSCNSLPALEKVRLCAAEALAAVFNANAAH